MDRRSLLMGLGALALGQGLASCSQASQEKLNIYLLRGAIPNQLLNQCQRQLGGKEFDLELETEINTLFQHLQSWHQAATSPKPEFSSSLVSLGDYWLSTAIRQGLIQPLTPTPSSWFRLSQGWQDLALRDRQGNPSPTGQIWAAPYRWGMTVIAYRKDKFRQLGWLPTDWKDLWRSDLKDRLSLLDHPREVIGLTLKSLGHSYNSPNPVSTPDLKQQLIALNQQAKFYSSESYLQPLVLGDTWAALGWSHDVLSLMRRNGEIGAIAPRSGTALWADLWVQRAGSPKPDTNPLAQQWIDFWWQPAIAYQLSQFSSGLSPALKDFSLKSPAQKLLLHPDIFARSEFLLPLSSTAIAEFRSLWTEIRHA
jgi:putative spermidine/putrescine transport system substrate-binding protein